MPVPASSPAPVPRLLLLGPVQLRIDDVEHPVRGIKQRIVLAHLALADGRPVSVDVLVDDLWPDEPPDDAAHAVQAHVSRLRRNIGVPIEFIEGAGYRLASDLFESDARLFTQLCARGREKLSTGDAAGAIGELDTALDLWRGPPLGDLTQVHGLRPFAANLEEIRRSANDDRIEAHLQTGRGEAVIGELRTSLDLDPLQEDGWRQLMLALQDTGRPIEAAATFRQARETFIEEVGAEPSEHLAVLHQEILRRDINDGATPPRVPDASTTLPESSPSDETGAEPGAGHRDAARLIGREGELATLTSIWHASTAGLQVVTISGEAGIGKTRLAGDFAAQIAATGGRVLAGRCDRANTEPYLPFVQILRDSLATEPQPPAAERLARHGAGLIRLVPEFARCFPDEVEHAHSPDTGAEDYRAMEAIAAWLDALAAERPLLLVIEDIQWADEQTLVLVHHLLSGPRTVPAQIILTVRDHERTGNEQHAALTELLRQGPTSTHLPLARLTAAQTRELLHAEATAVGGGGVLPEWAETSVRAASGGNPLFIVELARHLLTSQPEGPVPPTPAGLRQVIEARIARLPNHVQPPLRQAAAIGAEFDALLLTDITDGDPTDVDAMFDEAKHAQLIEPVSGTGLRYTFSHDIVRTVLYDSLSPRERAGLHTRIATSIEHRHGDDLANHHHRLAHHHRHSDSPRAATSAAEYLHRAGHDALARGAPSDAETLFTDALDLIGPAADPTRRCDLLIGLGRAQMRCAKPQYRETLLEASQQASALGDTDRLTAAVVANTRGWWSSTAEIDHERVAGIETALAACDDDPARRSSLLAAWALENVRDPACRDTALAVSAEALELAETSGNDEALATALSYRFAVLYALLGDPAECARLARRLLDIAHRTGDRWMRLSASLCLAQASTTLGEFSVADRYRDQALHLAEAIDHPPRLWLARGWEAMRAATRGNLEEAERLIIQTYDLGVDTQQDDAFTWFAGQLFILRLMQDRLPEIVESVREHAGAMTVSIPAWRAAMALTLAHSAYRDEAAAILDEFAAGAFEQLPRDILWLHGMAYLSMTCEELGRADIAAELYRTLVPYSGLVANNATLDAGPVDLHLGALAHLCGDTALAEEHLKAAIELCRRIDAPHWLERAHRIRGR